MKILFVKPRYFDRKHRSYFTCCMPPLGLTYLASMLIQNGYSDISILDMEAQRMEETGFYGYLKNTKPDIVAIDVRTPLVHKVSRLAKTAKEYSADIKVIIGGPHLFVMPQNALEIIADADVGLRGECEYTLLQLINGIHSGKNIDELQDIEGICFRCRDGKFFISPRIPLIEDIDALPMPAHYLLPLGKYFDNIINSKKYYAVMTTRGCPHRCIFCAQSLIYGRKARDRSVKNVLEEIEILVKKYNIGNITFVDPTFNHSIERVTLLCREILKRDLKFEWRAKLRVDLVNYEMLSLMKKAGCKLVSYGVESASGKTLAYLKKDFTTDNVRDAFKLTKEVGIEILGYFLLGSLNEVKEDCIKTICFARELDPLYVQFMFPLPLPGTELFQELRRKNILNDNWDNYYFYFLNYEHPSMTQKELKDLYIKANFDFYIRPSYLLRQLKHNADNFGYFLKKVNAGAWIILYLFKDMIFKDKNSKVVSR